MTLTAYAGVLTPAHRQVIAGIRDEWAAAVISTAPVDRAAAVEAVRGLYETHRLRQPSLTVWMDSPLGCIYAAAVVGELSEQLRDQFVSQLRRRQLQHQLGRQRWFILASQIRDQLGDQLGGRLRGPLAAELEDQLSDHLRGELSSRLWGQLRGQVKGKLHDQLWGQLDGRPWDEFWGQFGGKLRIRLGSRLASRDEDWGWDETDGWDGAEHLHSVFPWNDAHALAFDGCVLSILGRPADPRLDAVASAVAETGWLIPMPGAVIIGARPVALHRDARGDLHNPAGPAVTYPDGWGFYAWHGRRVPGWVIVAPSVEAITAEENVEVRRCAIESLGWDRFIAEAGLVPVTAGAGTAHVPDPGNPGQHLVLYDVPERLWGDRIRLLMCTNGTPERDGTRRRYGLKVPAHISDPVEAAAWTAGLGKDEYARMVRRT
jgi:hypothetical protein